MQSVLEPWALLVVGAVVERRQFGAEGAVGDPSVLEPWALLVVSAVGERRQCSEGAAGDPLFWSCGRCW